MSRRIFDKSHTITEAEYRLRDASEGKLLFTRVQGKFCGLLVQENRLMMVEVLPARAGRIGGIYIGKVKNIVDNIGACFVEITGGEICFLSLEDARKGYLTNRTPDGRILEGDEILVQLSREAHKTKQATVTAKIALSNEYFAVAYGETRIGFSNKLNTEEKSRLQEWLEKSDILEAISGVETGLVIRTQAAALKKEDFIVALKKFVVDWIGLFQTAKFRTCFSCIKRAPEDFERVLRESVLPGEYSEIVTDDKDFYEKLNNYALNHFLEKKIRLYEDSALSLGTLYALNAKLKRALDTKVWLDSGAYLVMEATEAMTVIDVNSGKREGGKRSSQEEIFHMNCEAAREIAMQLRLRNLSGIIVVDFISMNSKQMEKELLDYMEHLTRHDSQKTCVIDITPLGLMEITRKRGQKSLREQFSKEI